MSDVWASLLEAHEAVRDPARTQVPDHAPVAAILTCSDARVPPSVIFDQPAGSLFVVRVAGNTASPAAVASFDYAIRELGVELVIVLGHTSCGAVAAACSGAEDPYLEPLLGQIQGLVAGSACHDAERLGRLNVRATVEALGASDSPTGQEIRAGRVAIHGAIYDIAADTVQPLDIFPPTPLPLFTQPEKALQGE